MSNQPVRLKRKDCYFGLHFDFHARLSDKELGKNLSREMLETVIEKVKPDYMQCDAKGHPGIASYPTEVGVSADSFIIDPLKLWREVTAEKGVSLLVHYSGVWDYEMAARHPDWASKDADGTPSSQGMSTIGPYAEQVMIPQLKEIRERYDVDGVWIDGDCWGVTLDYSDAMVAAFRHVTGDDGTFPKQLGDPYFNEWSEFNRESFRAYVRKITTELHRAHPGFEIASNWAYSSFMPEPISADVDFLSGDLASLDSVNSARLEARVLAAQNLHWDLMSWSYNREQTRAMYSTKSNVQLMQEAASVIALGGGFQLYLKQRRDASVHMWPMDMVAEVARFCRERQKWCHHAELIPQVGLLLSSHALYRSSGKVFGGWGDSLDGLRGALQGLLDSGHVVNMVMEHTLDEDLKVFPMIVVPEWGELEEACKGKLLSYANDGGKLLLIGPRAVDVFASELGIDVYERASDKLMWLSHRGKLAGLQTSFLFANVAAAGHERFGGLHAENDLLEPSMPAASVIPYGKGAVSCVYFQYGALYLSEHTSVQRDFLGDLVGRMLPEPGVEVSGSHRVDVVYARKNGNLLVHLINTSGPHADPTVAVFDELQPIGPLKVVLRNVEQPVRICCQPEGTEIPFAYEAGKITVAGVNVTIHCILVVEFQGLSKNNR